MIEFKSPQLSDRQWAAPLMGAECCIASHCNFANLYLWSRAFRQEIARADDRLLTAVFSYKGQSFILSTAHYADSRSSSQWAKEQLAAIADAQSAFSSPLHVILTGDLYTGRTQSSPDSAYKYLVANGYVDSQQSAPLNGNQNRSHGTFHKIGTRETNRISEDFVWCKGELQPLAFKVLVNKISDDASDHYPVMADIKFS